MTPPQEFAAAWVALALVLAGLGALVQRCWRAPVEGADGWLRCFWLGWCALLLILQVWHFAFPIDDRVLFVVVPLGVLGLLLSGTRPWKSFGRGLLRHLPALVILALATAWLANRATGGNGNGDTGYYFIPTVAWLRAHPIVPGLANLSAPLAYNQTYFHYVALLETGPFVEGSHHIANALLLLALIARGLLGASRILDPGGGRPADIFYMAFTPAALRLVFQPNFTSPAPDFAVFMVGGVLTGELIDLVARPGRIRDTLPAMAVLTTAALTVKLSLAALAGTTLLVAGLVALRRGVGARTMAVTIVLALVSMSVWMAGNVVMSGYPLYPSGVAAMPVAWLVPIDVAGLIRESSSLHGSIDLAWKDPKWFLNSLDSLGWNTREVILPLAMSLAAIVVSPLLWLYRRRGERRPGVSAITLLPTVVALVFWFVTAPRPRFAGASFWLLGIQAVLVALGGSIATRNGRGAVSLLTLALGGLAFHDGGPFFQAQPSPHAWPDPVLHPQTLASGLVVSSPENMSCWDALLCTPTPNHGLTLLDPPDPGGGFRIDHSLLPPVTTEPKP